jgi:hypothetical protein
MLQIRKKTFKQMVTERESLAKSVPPIDVKSLQKFCRSKLDFFDQFGEKELTASGPLWYKDNGSNVLAVLPLDVSEKAPLLHPFGVA